MAEYRTGQAKVSSAAAPGTAPTAVLAGAGAGSIDNGSHSYKITFVHTNGGETIGSPVSAVVTVVDKTVNGKVALSAIPLGPTGAASRKVYRTVAGDSGNHKLVATIANNTATTYEDNTADASLGADIPATNAFPTNKVTLSTGVTTGNIAAGDRFAFDPEGVWFQVSSIDGGDTKVFYLSEDYSGSKALGTFANYAVSKDFTPNVGLPEMAAGDVIIRALYTRSMRLIDALLGAKRLTNRLGLALALGDVVALSTANDSSVVADDTASRVRPYVVALEATADVVLGSFLAYGFAGTVKSQGVVTRGNYLVKSATARAVADGGVAATSANPPKGALGVALTGSAGGASTVAALWFGGLPNPLASPVAVADGGTGLASYTIGDLIYASAVTVLAKLADVAAGSYLRSGGVGAAPVWSTLTLPNAAAIGELLYGSASNALAMLAAVADGSVLRSAGVGVAPSWGKVRLSGSPTDIAGTLGVVDGGTGGTTQATAQTGLGVPSVAEAAACFFSGTPSNTATTRYVGPNSTTVSATESVVASEVPRAGTLKNLRVVLTAAPGGSDTVVVTARKNSGATALSVTITGAATSGQDADSVAFALGDTLDFEVVWSATAVASVAKISTVYEK